MAKKDDPNRICQECHMELKDAGEYHPLSFCVLVKAGVSPWQLLADVMWEGLAGQVGRDPRPLQCPRHEDSRRMNTPVARSASLREPLTTEDK